MIEKTDVEEIGVIVDSHGNTITTKNGKRILDVRMDIDTGEIRDMICEGDTISHTTQEDKLRRAERRQKKASRDEYGSFTKFFYSSGRQLDLGISDASLARLFYLCTFGDYAGVLVRNDSNPCALTKRECRNLLGMNENAFYGFWNEVTKKGLLVYKDQKIILNSRYFVRSKTSRGSQFVRLGHEGVRALYTSCEDSRKHKLISYIFDLIPLMNRSYGVICENPDEKFRSHVQLATVGTLSDALGYDKSHIGRIMKSLTDLRLQFRSQKDVPALYEIPKGIYGGKKAYIINPRICCAASSHIAIENEIATYSDLREISDAV